MVALRGSIGSSPGPAEDSPSTLNQREMVPFSGLRPGWPRPARGRVGHYHLLHPCDLRPVGREGNMALNQDGLHPVPFGLSRHASVLEQSRIDSGAEINGKSTAPRRRSRACFSVAGVLLPLPLFIQGPFLSGHPDESSLRRRGSSFFSPPRRAPVPKP
jgi:hypothetical protein